MKLDKMQFAKVLVYIAGIVQRNNLDSTDINVLDDMIDIEVPYVEATQRVYPKNENVERLMMLMVEGTRKIDAIKEHRTITGMGLKESKDAVERYWPNRQAAGWTLNELHDKLNELPPSPYNDAIKSFLNNL